MFIKNDNGDIVDFPTSEQVSNNITAATNDMATKTWVGQQGYLTQHQDISGKADKVTGATAGDIAKLDSNGNLVDGGDTVKKAESMASDVKTNQEIVYRKSQSNIDSSLLRIGKLKGKTLVWNQIFNSAIVGTELFGLSFSDNGNTITINGTVTATTTGGLAEVKKLIAGHKYYIGGNKSLNINGIDLYLYASILGVIYATNNYVIFDNTITDNSLAIYYHLENGTSANGLKISFLIIDLTLMFGTGNEPSTVEEFEAMFPLPCYDYHPGKLINNGNEVERTLYWNQLCSTKTFTNQDTDTRSYLDFQLMTIDGAGNNFRDGEVVFTNTPYLCKQIFTATYSTLIVKHNGATLDIHIYTTSVVPGHKYLSSIYFESASPTVSNGIITYNMELFDLTAMFGAGNEPQTPEEFEELFPEPYYPYNSGETKTFYFPQLETKLETVGFNLWDEETRFGDYSGANGEFLPNPSASVLCSKNPIPVLPSTTYFFETDANASWVYFYDANMNFISSSAVNNTTFTTPNNAHFMNFNINVVSGRVCINLSDESKNGTYEPYKKNVLPLNVSNLRVKSPNIWDEEWERGGIDRTTGDKVTNSEQIRTKNYVPVLPNTVYYLNRTSAFGNFAYFDANKVFIQNSGARITGTFTTPANAYYMLVGFEMYSSDYNNDICINLSNPGINGHYYPHGSFNPFPDGLRSAGNVYDEIVGNKVIRRVSSVDLGTLDWRAEPTTDNLYRMQSEIVIDVAAPTASTEIANIICNKYPTKSTERTWLHDVGISVESDDTIKIYDTNYNTSTSAADFKSAMSGVTLYYELAVPEEFELITPLCYTIKSGTTERRLPIDTPSTPNVPLCCDLTYTADASSVWEDMNSKIGNIELLLSKI